MILFQKNVKLKKSFKSSAWRKIAIGTWRSAKDPSVYSSMNLPMDSVLKYIDSLKNKTDTKITITHFMGKAVSTILKNHPQINSILRFGKIYQRENIDVFFQVASDTEGKDLSGCVIRSLENKSIIDIAKEMKKHVEDIREKGDPALKKVKASFGLMPGFLSGFILDFISFINYSLNIWIPAFGNPKDSFGSIMITNVGSLGIKNAFTPLIHYSRIPMLLSLGAIEDVPFVKDGEVSIRKEMVLCVTFDHRIIDGVHAAKMAKTLTTIFENPRLIEKE